MPTLDLMSASSGCSKMTVRAMKNTTTMDAIRLDTKRALFTLETTKVDQAITVSKLNATRMKGIETPAETDTALNQFWKIQG